MPDYDEYPDVPNYDFFVKCTDQYNNEREMYSVLQMEGWNQRGVELTYYPVSISADYLFGEDNARVILRRFECMSYYEDPSLPKEDKMFSLMGVPGLDQFIAHINKYHLTYASTFDSSGTSGVYPEYFPKIGDIINAHYNNQFYEVVMVKEEEEIFLQAKHSWTLFLINFKNKGYLISEELMGTSDPIIDIVETKDIYDITDTIDSEKLDILYKPKIDECEIKPGDAGW